MEERQQIERLFFQIVIGFLYKTGKESSIFISSIVISFNFNSTESSTDNLKMEFTLAIVIVLIVGSLAAPQLGALGGLVGPIKGVVDPAVGVLDPARGVLGLVIGLLTGLLNGVALPVVLPVALPV